MRGRRQSLAVTVSSSEANCRRAASRRVGTCSARHRVGRRLVAAQDLPCHRRAVDLVRAVVDPSRARVAVHRLERQVGRVAERAVGLQRAVDDVVQNAGAEVLDHRDVGACRGDALGVHPPRRVEGHQPRRLHLGGRVGDPVLHRLVARRASSRGLRGRSSARRACRTLGARPRASACSGGSGPGRGAAGRSGSRRPRRRAARRPGTRTSS